MKSLAWDEFDFEQTRPRWGMVLLLGLLLLLLGVVATSAAVTATMLTILFLGTILLASGILQLITTFQHMHSGGFWLHLFGAVLDLVFGALLISKPAASAAALTLALTAFFFVGGFFRIAASMTLRQPSWGWTLASGIINVLLAVTLFLGWPTSSLWFIGLAVGIALIFQGWAWITFSLALHRCTGAPS